MQQWVCSWYHKTKPAQCLLIFAVYNTVHKPKIEAIQMIVVAMLG